ncbi:MAG: zinc ribbon domain-containing protein [Candidatus Thorarchaeota archaeon]|nr:MAG: hypothetical protein DRP09_13995 [Candidatus Thorarchaeota archaeon]RLI58733.1 MAG: hypothetical protein DRO87_04935 [Candidatus Thorarchaeota archaeon]
MHRQLLHATDENPDTYTIRLNEVAIETGQWISGEDIIIEVDGLESRETPYRYEITVEDDYVNSASDNVFVTVNAASGGENPPPTAPISDPGLSLTSVVVAGGFVGAVLIAATAAFLMRSGRISLSSGSIAGSTKRHRQTAKVLPIRETTTTVSAGKGINIGKMCPFCGSMNSPASQKCTNCGVDI